MNTSIEPEAVKAWHRAGIIHVALKDGRTVNFPAQANARLRDATHTQRNHIEVSPYGLHWPDLDEDLSVAGILAGRHDRPQRGGVRVGAGRKPAGHVRMQIVVTPQTRRRIEALAKRERLTLSGAVERLAAVV